MYTREEPGAGGEDGEGEGELVAMPVERAGGGAGPGGSFWRDGGARPGRVSGGAAGGPRRQGAGGAALQAHTFQDFQAGNSSTSSVTRVTSV